MVQSIDGINKPVYSAVNIHITKPEVNAASSNQTTLRNDNGIYNSVKIDIDNPRINTEPNSIYDYPQNDEIITYNMLDTNKMNLPKELPVVSAYYESSIITPAEENENSLTESIPSQEIVDVPEPNYTTLEKEKAATEDTDNSKSSVQFQAAPKVAEKKTPEIIPSVEIKPEIDVSEILENLESKDLDKQAQQIEEIARNSINRKEGSNPYIVKDIFTGLINIINQNNTKMEGPSDKQIEIRDKIIANIIAAELAKQQNQPVQMPFQLTDEEIAIADELSPLEKADRNKEYAIYTVALLSKNYIDELYEKTGNVVPFTDIPGISDIINTLRYDANPRVKMVCIDALKHINRPEYKNELNTVFSIAKNSYEQMVSRAAESAIETINK